MDTRVTIYQCPVCSGLMKHYATNDSFSTYVCEVCSAQLGMRVRTKSNKIKIKGVSMRVTNKSVYNLLKREYGHESNER